MKKHNKKQFNRVNKNDNCQSERGDMSRRHFLLGAGSLVFGGALGGGLLSGCKEEVTTTKMITTTKTVSVPTTVEVPVTTTVTETGYLTETSTVTSTVTDSGAKTITVTDSRGREVTLNLPVNRVVYLHPTLAEGLKIIDAWDKVIAVDNYTTNNVFFPNLGSLPVIAMTESGTIDYEAIITLQPDVVLVLAAPGHYDVDAMIAALEPEIPVVAVFDIYAADAWPSGIELLGKIMQKEEEAQEFIEFCRNIEANIGSKTLSLSDEEKPGIFIKVPGYTSDQFSSYTNEFAFIANLMAVTGAVNVAADLPSTGGWVENVDMEWLITQPYEFIMATLWDSLNPGVLGYNVQNTIAAQKYHTEMMQLPAFSASQAVADGNLYITDTTLTTTPRYFILMEYMAKMLHPDLFADLDPKATHQEYLSRFMRVDFSLEESGVFFYPEP
jgi:iron complex transport system substrate-binding protein